MGRGTETYAALEDDLDASDEALAASDDAFAADLDELAEAALLLEAAEAAAREKAAAAEDELLAAAEAAEAADLELEAAALDEEDAAEASEREVQAAAAAWAGVRPVEVGAAVVEVEDDEADDEADDDDEAATELETAVELTTNDVADTADEVAFAELVTLAVTKMSFCAPLFGNPQEAWYPGLASFPCHTTLVGSLYAYSGRLAPAGREHVPAANSSSGQYSGSTGAAIAGALAEAPVTAQSNAVM